MNTEQISLFYKDKETKDCPLTERLIKAGYQQEKHGYISYAYELEMEVDYRNAKPSQWWHLINSYCKRTKPDVTFTKRIQCGELILWMAEVSGCIEKRKLESLVGNIIASGTPVNRRKSDRPKIHYDRKKWNKEIQKLCFDKIVEEVELKCYK